MYLHHIGCILQLFFSESVYLPPLVLSTTDVFPFPTSAPETTNYHYTLQKTNLFSTTVGTHNKQDISTHIHSTQYSEVDDQELGNHTFRYECVYIKKKHNLVSLQCNARMTPLSQSDSIFHSLPHTYMKQNTLR